MEELENIIKLSNLLNELSLKIPEGAEEMFDANGIKFTLKKEEGVIKLISEENTSNDFDDSDIKDLIKEYKENIENLDDDLFLEIVEDISTKVDLNKFNELLDLETFTEDEASEVEEMINISADIISSHLQNKIQEMVKLYEKF
jgi:hypothetical protein